MLRSNALALYTVLASLSISAASAQTLNYQWLNLPCADNLNCVTNGCSSCNLPDGGTASFVGANVSWMGVEVCPHPVAVGDNAVFTSNWPMAPHPLVYVGLSAVAMQDVRVDSIIILHRRSADGPQRLRVQYTNDAMQVAETIGDTEIMEQYHETIFTDLGCLAAQSGSAYTGFQLRMQAYQGSTEGSWQLDALRIVATPCNGAQVGITENFQRPLEGTGTYVDVLGRPVNGQPAPGLYLGSRKRVQVF